MSLRQNVLQDSSFLLFIAERSRDLLQPDEALQDTLVVIFVLTDLDRLHHR